MYINLQTLATIDTPSRLCDFESASKIELFRRESELLFEKPFSRLHTGAGKSRNKSEMSWKRADKRPYKAVAGVVNVNGGGHRPVRTRACHRDCSFCPFSPIPCVRFPLLLLSLSSLLFLSFFLPFSPGSAIFRVETFQRIACFHPVRSSISRDSRGQWEGEES